MIRKIEEAQEVRCFFKFEIGHWLLEQFDPFQHIGIGACGASPLDDPNEPETEGGFEP